MHRYHLLPDGTYSGETVKAQDGSRRRIDSCKKKGHEEASDLLLWTQVARIQSLGIRLDNLRLCSSKRQQTTDLHSVGSATENALGDGYEGVEVEKG
jgi:hypothetical protein